METKSNALSEIKRAVELAIDQVKTKAGDATVILVGGGSIILPTSLTGVSNLIRPKYLEVANAVGAAIGKISGAVDQVAVPGEKSIDQFLEEAKSLAIKRCVEAGGKRETTEIVEIDVVPLSYVTNGATRLMVRVVADLTDQDPIIVDSKEETVDSSYARESSYQSWREEDQTDGAYVTEKVSTYEITPRIDVEGYRPKLEGDLWYLSETDLQFLQDGTGVLGVGSCGEPYPSYIACLEQLRAGKPITIRRQDTIPDCAVIVGGGFMGSPTVYLERISGEHEYVAGSFIETLDLLMQIPE